MLTIDASVWVAAFEVRDQFHTDSVSLLRALESGGVRMWAPSLVLLEVSCAVSRRSQDANVASAVDLQLRAHPLLSLRALDDELLETARIIGTQRFLRAADALYAATATLEGAPLVTWDNELLTRAQAMTPTRAMDLIADS